MAVWNTELTSTEISELYNSGDGARADSITPPFASDGAWVEGVSGSYALAFDGIAAVATVDYVGFGGEGSVSSLALQPSSGTYAAWVKMGDSVFSVMFGAGPKDGSSGANSSYGPNLYSDISANKLMANIGNNASYAYKITTGALTVGVWHHVAMTWESTYSAGSDLKVYIDGVEDGASAAQSGYGWTVTSDKANRQFILGAKSNVEDTGNTFIPFSGSIDDFACWDVVLDIVLMF